MAETTGSRRSPDSKWSFWNIFVVLFGFYVLFTVFGKTLSWIIIISGALYFLKAIDFVQNLIKRFKESDDDYWDLCCFLNGCLLRRVCACAHYQSKHAKFVNAQKNTKGAKSEERENQSTKGCADASLSKKPTEIEMKEIKKRNPIPDDASIAWKTDINDPESGTTPCTYMSTFGTLPGYWRCGFEGGGEADIQIDDWCSKSGQVPDYIPTRIGYYRDGHRYPHRTVHPNDEIGQKHLKELKDHWASKTFASAAEAKPITNFSDDETK